MRTIKIISPASVANLVCGFDVLGMSLIAPADEMIMSFSEAPGIHITHIDDYGLSEAPEKKCCGCGIAGNDERIGSVGRI